MASNIFTNLENVIKTEGESLVKTIKGIYQFNIATAAGEKIWSVDLKNGSGSLKADKHEKPDCTITMKEEDFVNLMNGKLNGQTAFAQKKLKIGGNMAFAMKLSAIVKKLAAATPAAPSTTAAAPAAAAGGSLDDGTPLGKVFAELAKTVAGKPELVKQINGVYLFDVGTKKYTVDLKNEKGSVKAGVPAKADCTISIKEEDLINLMSGKVNGQVLFGQGKLKIKGNMGLAMKLGKITAAAPKAKL
ncbi:Nonspecific lipid-transfer protein [Cavenderia fasciculata]|uniref:Nonspecific lipid-transfer protein n=1 Tax=Cavenderia fasciculata TaxID=261658 RepID=F4PVH5_CACFS|nr:Nonspecific lipid-transfer protein [Cavenderia fasciculata]EGG19989.1 Nonspecific lipid-transfer protein [Cavenderia fasciculata]|eukprot:XP_004366972.1 Nonspecific lipid-transfer protein [Cavenderia fasciculata]